MGTEGAQDTDPFDAEWAAYQAAARDEVARTRLNGLEPGGGTVPGPELAADSGAKREAADRLEQDLVPDAARVGDAPVGELEGAAARLSGWESATGLRDLAEVWSRKAGYLRDQLEAEAVVLRAAASGFLGTEAEIAYRLAALRGEVHPW
ncbi:hypothetical protein [Streptomyces sp. NPDC049881]|uniref:hypothetical protein n=1 Tax=Streptomyces sp. NPDC049881 TaxID=3155778 RepID=UPI003432530F